MRKLVVLFFLLPAFVFAQENIGRRVVYLWDVTYSMHGGYMTADKSKKGKVLVAGNNYEIVCYNEKYDIYTSIMNKLIADIDGQDERTEIVVIPFNDKVLEESVWRSMATEKGKQYLVSMIRNFCELDQTKTCIYSPLKYGTNNKNGAL